MNRMLGYLVARSRSSWGFVQGAGELMTPDQRGALLWYSYFSLLFVTFAIFGFPG